MDGNTTLINGQPIGRDVKEIAADEDGVNTAIVGFFEDAYVRTSDRSGDPAPRSEDRDER